jgi:iron complex outermembrane receptor protein
MFKRTKLSASLLIAFGGAVASTAAIAQQALERVEITGSSIRRVESEGALPVQVIKREDIEKTGATSITDLLQKLPGIQNATTEAASVGGGGGGFAGVSIHNIGETRTLVLLNGRRLAQFGGQTLTGFGAAIDLNTLPLASIDRVEILTDGASALYGSDAVAGVVNFITKRKSTTGDITLGISDTDEGGAKERRASFTKGFGDFDADGFNVVLSASIDKRDPLNGPQRDVSKSGRIDFSKDGKRYRAFLGSPSASPGNATINGEFRNPYFELNGECAPGTVPVLQPSGNTSCYFDFVAALEIYPERERKNLMVSATKKLGDNHELYADFLMANTESTGIIAAVPGSVIVAAGTPAHDTYIRDIFGVTTDVRVNYRATDLGGRADYNESKFKNFVVGLKGDLAGWAYNTGLTYSESKFKNDITGYPGLFAFQGLLGSGLINPFLLTGQQSAEGAAALAGIAYKGNWDGGVSKLTTFDVTASRDLMDLPGGPLAIGLGFNAYQEKFQGKPSLFAQNKLADPVAGTLCDPDSADPELACDFRFGDEAAFIPYSADRKVYGVFAELNAPISKSFEVTGAVRFDKYDEVGNTTNGKASFRWTPTKGLLLRGSVGTGFKAPTVPQLKASAQSYGVTSTPYPCTPALEALATSLGAVCKEAGLQYDVVAGGNPNLEPEKSRQASIGLVFEPTPEISVGADLWHVQIRDSFGQITEDAAFGDPATYAGSFTTKVDPLDGTVYLALNQANLNLGKAFYTGVDFNLQTRTNSSFGKWSNQLVATWMVREKQQLSIGGQYYSSIGKNSPDLGLVTFRWQGRLTTTLETGNWRHSLQTNFKSGYRDTRERVEVLGPDDTSTGTFEIVQLRIKPFFTFDWQTQWQATKSIALTAGVLNLLNEAPPLTLTQGGSGKGQMFGYDDRYYDVRGRTFYLNGSLAF